MSVRLSASDRLRAIERIMEARFMVAAFDEIRRGAARGIHGQVQREKERLQGTSDAQLCAELAELN